MKYESTSNSRVRFCCLLQCKGGALTFCSNSVTSDSASCFSCYRNTVTTTISGTKTTSTCFCEWHRTTRAVGFLAFIHWPGLLPGALLHHHNYSCHCVIDWNHRDGTTCHLSHREYWQPAPYFCLKGTSLLIRAVHQFYGHCVFVHWDQNVKKKLWTVIYKDN